MKYLKKLIKLKKPPPNFLHAKPKKEMVHSGKC